MNTERGSAKFTTVNSNKPVFVGSRARSPMESTARRTEYQKFIDKRTLEHTTKLSDLGKPPKGFPSRHSSVKRMMSDATTTDIMHGLGATVLGTRGNIVQHCAVDLTQHITRNQGGHSNTQANLTTINIPKTSKGTGTTRNNGVNNTVQEIAPRGSNENDKLRYLLYIFLITL